MKKKFPLFSLKKYVAMILETNFRSSCGKKNAKNNSSLSAKYFDHRCCRFFSLSLTSLACIRRTVCFDVISLHYASAYMDFSSRR